MNRNKKAKENLQNLKIVLLVQLDGIWKFGLLVIPLSVAYLFFYLISIHGRDIQYPMDIVHLQFLNIACILGSLFSYRYWFLSKYSNRFAYTVACKHSYPTCISWYKYLKHSRHNHIRQKRRAYCKVSTKCFSDLFLFSTWCHFYRQTNFLHHHIMTSLIFHFYDLLFQSTLLLNNLHSSPSNPTSFILNIFGFMPNMGFLLIHPLQISSRWKQSKISKPYIPVKQHHL